MQLKTTLFVLLISNSLTLCGWAETNDKTTHPELLELSGKHIDVQVNHDLSLTVLQHDAGLLWESSKTHIPNIMVRANDTGLRMLTLASAAKVSRLPFDNGKYRGYTVHLSGFDETDVELDLVFAIDAAADELLLQVAQAGGRETVVSTGHFYRFEKAVSDGGYMVLPHGSGYLIAAECPDALPGKGARGGLIGARWTLPIFGMMRDDGNSMCAIVEAWWDCNVTAEHSPGDRSSFDLNWQGSLGKLAYPRRFVLRFANEMDYVAMAKRYRQYASEHGLLRTLEEKAAQTPVIRKFINNIQFRWYEWDSGDRKTSANCRLALPHIKKLQELGFGVNFFFPKWAEGNHGAAFLLAETPVPGGWKAVAEFAGDVHELDSPTQCFINLRAYSSHEVLDEFKHILDNVEAKGLRFDSFFFGGYSAYDALPTDASPSHPMTQRQGYEMQNACFAETRRRGMMPAAEQPRFWCVADCDNFFFTDWSSDRLLIGEPIPLFQLVFNDCYSAGFSGGGYPRYNWSHTRTPRLYELIFATAPSYNWLPEANTLPVHDWDTDQSKLRLAWLKRWALYHQAVTLSEMVSHQFLSADRKLCRIEFANGVTAEFNMAQNKFRVKDVAGFNGQWETPEKLPDYSENP